MRMKTVLCMCHKISSSCLKKWPSFDILKDETATLLLFLGISIFSEIQILFYLGLSKSDLWSFLT